MQLKIDELFRAAAAYHGEGKLVDAERLYRLILARDPHHPGALHRLGLIAMEAGYLADAERLMRHSIEVRPDNSDFRLNLAEALRRAGNVEASKEQLRRAIEIDPRCAMAYSNMAVALSNEGLHAESVTWARKALEVRPDYVLALLSLGQSLIEIGQSSEAAQVLERCKADPQNESARFFLAAATGRPVASAPRMFVERLFDRYADSFDQHVMTNLGYRVPELLRGAVDRLRPEGSFDILDLGCGTGLTGARFRDRARSLVGVDLSRGMLQQALKRGIYDSLELGDLVPSLRSRPGQIDLILAGDVLVYVGDLSGIFVAALESLRKGGLFAFTVELHDGEGYALRASRRFAHARSYVESLASAGGFTLLCNDAAILRHERGKDMEGVVYVLTRPG